MTTTAMPVPLAAGSMSTFILLIAVVIGFMFLVQRPMRKQQQAQRDLQNSITEGARVMLTSGMFGTVTHLGEKQAIVELAPGLEVTVMRQAISKAVAPADEEFEFSDDSSTVVEAYTDAAGYSDGSHAAGTFGQQATQDASAHLNAQHENVDREDVQYDDVPLANAQHVNASEHPDTADALTHEQDLTGEHVDQTHDRQRPLDELR